MTSQPVSELSAIGAPTRPLWMWLGTLYALMAAAFGCGVWRSAGRSRALRVVGAVIVLDGLMSLHWPPMHARGAELTLTDTLHIVWTAATVALMLLAVGFGAAALGKRFRLYSIATLAVFVLFGALTGVDAPRIAAGQPTPWTGVWERINIAAYMLWVIVLAAILLRDRHSAPRKSAEVYSLPR